MPRRPDNQEAVRVALELLRRIPRNKKISAPELHQQLKDVGIERDLRTIQRQLKMLSEYFDIEREPTRPAGYRWKKHAQGMTIAAMTEQEALLLSLAQQRLKFLLPPKVSEAMEAFFEQARRNLDPFGDRKLAREWLSKVRVVPEGLRLLPPTIAPGVLDIVSQALYLNHWLQVRYRNAEEKTSDARVMPLGLAQQGSRLYLVCRYDGFTNERSLALHRIQSAHAETISFDRPKDFDLARYEDEGRFAFGDGQRVNLTFRIVKRYGKHLIETPLSADQSIREDGDELIVTATVVDSDHLESWLLGFGENVRSVRKRKIAAPPAKSSPPVLGATGTRRPRVRR